jgi:hypothetical protein
MLKIGAALFPEKEFIKGIFVAVQSCQRRKTEKVVQILWRKLWSIKNRNLKLYGRVMSYKNHFCDDIRELKEEGVTALPPSLPPPFNGFRNASPLQTAFYCDLENRFVAREPHGNHRSPVRLHLLSSVVPHPLNSLLRLLALCVSLPIIPRPPPV